MKLFKLITSNGNEEYDNVCFNTRIVSLKPRNKMYVGKMVEGSSREDLLEVYVRSLEDHIENKKYFLQKARDVIQALQNKSDAEQLTSEETFQTLLRKPMFFPERSDPVGLSLSFASLDSRKATSIEWLKYTNDHLKQMKDMLAYQRDANRNLTVLIELLEQKANSRQEIASDKSLVPKSSQEYHEHLLKKLNDFVRNYLSVDIANPEDIGLDLYEEIMSYIRRLVNYDPTLKVSDFHHSSKSLYRLLLRSNLIEIEARDDGIRYVRLLDFTDSNIF